MAAPRRDGACPLFIAAQSGYAECARLLLEAGAEVDQARLVGQNSELSTNLRGHSHMMSILERG